MPPTAGFGAAAGAPEGKTPAGTFVGFNIGGRAPPVAEFGAAAGGNGAPATGAADGFCTIGGTDPAVPCKG